MDEIIASAKEDFIGAKRAVVHALETTPDDRINWSPAPTCRTPLQITAHVAHAIANIHEMLDGRPFGIPDTAAADRGFRESEREYTRRDEVVRLLDRVSRDYLAFLDELTPERLDTPITLPFGLGTAPLRAGLKFAPAHTRGHAPQIEYIQTIYGDHDWHMPSH